LGADVTVIGNIDLWYAGIYRVMSVAYQLSAAARDRKTAAKVAPHLRQLDSVLGKMFKDIRKEMDKGGINCDETKPEQIKEVIQLLVKLHGILHGFLHACKVARLTNNSLTAQPIHNIENWNEEVAELMEIMGLLLHPEAVNSVYKRSKHEREHGEIFDLSEV
jgi:enoyl-[acyl-carrier-protein] reductase (NADH)